jgi:predicted RNA binding protein YcfA (HicA-like mRNA interferase family)
MPKLPKISGDDAVKVFQKLGWELSRQRGSHMIMTKSGSIYSLSIPKKRVLAPGLLRDLIRKADISVDDFISLL